MYPDVHCGSSAEPAPDSDPGAATRSAPLDSSQNDFSEESGVTTASQVRNFVPSGVFTGPGIRLKYPACRNGNPQHRAGVAQVVEQRIRNAQVGGSNPSTGTNLKS